MVKKKRILIKISGASIKSKKANGFFDFNIIKHLCNQIKQLNVKYDIGLVIGGGNIWRGNMDSNQYLQRSNADYIGMLSTIANSFVFKDILESLGVKAALFSALSVGCLTKPIVSEKIEKAFANKKVCIFAAGTGHPYFTTDTGCVIRAIDMQANIILMGKDAVDGVFTDDPKKNKNAKFIPNTTFSNIINKKLKVMDLSALTLCEENNIDIYVFNILANNGIVKTLQKKCRFTHIHK